MERSNDTKDTVSSVEGKHEMGIRERKDADLKETQETLTTRVETTGKSLATFKKEQTVDGYSETELHGPRWT